MAVPVHRAVGQVRECRRSRRSGALLGHANQIARGVPVDELAADVRLVALTSAPVAAVLPVAALEQQAGGHRRSPGDLSRAQRSGIRGARRLGRRRRRAATQMVDARRLLVPEDVELVLARRLPRQAQAVFFQVPSLIARFSSGS